MMTMMKNPVILAACALLLTALAVQASESSFGPDECCFKFYSKRLPRRQVIDLKYTGKLCPMEGVLFKMKSGSVLCADPSMQWVKTLVEAKLKDLARKQNTTVTTVSTGSP